MQQLFEALLAGAVAGINEVEPQQQGQHTNGDHGGEQATHALVKRFVVLGLDIGLNLDNCTHLLAYRIHQARAFAVVNQDQRACCIVVAPRVNDLVHVFKLGLQKGRYRVDMFLCGCAVGQFAQLSQAHGDVVVDLQVGLQVGFATS